MIIQAERDMNYDIMGGYFGMGTGVGLGVS